MVLIEVSFRDGKCRNEGAKDAGGQGGEDPGDARAHTAGRDVS